MKKNKKTLTIVIVVLILILISLIIFFKSIKEDNQKNEKIMNEINQSYISFENNISTYNTNRETLSNYLKDYYQDNLETDYQKYITLLTEQEKTIIELEKNTKEIDNNCKNRIFNKKEINDICSSYQEYYETVVNVYINDYNQINIMIQKYNDTATNKLEEYVSKNIKDYIDYNKDGKYIEREEV